MEPHVLCDDECFILVKALPHRSSKYFETVCCAGIGRDGRWRRQYPVPFRILNDSQKFQRWSWIKYNFVASKIDARVESQKVLSESLIVSGKLKPNERARFLNPLVRYSFAEADRRNESLTMLRPQSLEILAFEKTEREIASERVKHAALVQQLSFLSEPATPLEPCPVRFVARWRDNEGSIRRHACDDWETSAAFSRFERHYGRNGAIEVLRRKYEEEYFQAGLVLVFSTHSRRNVTKGMKNQWLLVGMVRLDHDSQRDLFSQ